MKQTSLEQKPLKTIRLSEEDLTDLLDRLDAESNSTKSSPTDNSTNPCTQFSYRSNPSPVIHMQQAGPFKTTAFICPTRYISRDILCCLHGGYIHEQTLCVVQLITRYGSWQELSGRVCDCRQIQGSIHEMEIHVDNLIDPSIYCAEATRNRVLLVDSSSTITRLTKRYLADLNADVTHVENGNAAIETAMKKFYDLILMDLELPELDGIIAAKELRNRGYTGLIVAFTALVDEESRQRAKDAGFDRFLAKPFASEDLASLIHSLSKEPLFSIFQGDPKMADLLVEFVEGLPPIIQKLKLTAQSGDTAHAASLARELMAASGVYGFDVISDAAAKVEKILVKKASDEELEEAMTHLSNVTREARA